VTASLHRIEAGSYEVRRDGVKLTGPVLLLQAYAGWDLVVGGVHQVRHRSYGAGRAWLATPEGVEWLAALPAAVEPTP
jgi:hypothetical protein